MSWHKKNPVDLTLEERQQKHLDYYNTFYSTPENRRVLADLKRFIEQGSPESILDSKEVALAKLALLRLYDYIRESAGVIDQSAVIEAEATIGRDYQAVEEKPKEKNIYDEQE